VIALMNFKIFKFTPSLLVGEGRDGGINESFEIYPHLTSPIKGE